MAKKKATKKKVKRPPGRPVIVSSKWAPILFGFIGEIKDGDAHLEHARPIGYTNGHDAFEIATRGPRECNFLGPPRKAFVRNIQLVVDVTDEACELLLSAPERNGNRRGG